MSATRGLEDGFCLDGPGQWESTRSYYSIRQNLLCYEVGLRPDLTGRESESYHVHSSHGGLLDAARHASCHGGGLRRHPSGLRRTLPTLAPAQRQACGNRCSIASCQQRPLAARLCDANAQTICNTSFRSCSDACTTSFAATAATIQAQASCTTSCCTKLKLCLGQRQCEIGTITAITCEEGNPF